MINLAKILYLLKFNFARNMPRNNKLSGNCDFINLSFKKSDHGFTNFAQNPTFQKKFADCISQNDKLTKILTFIEI